jgi:FtsZ-binding cell division protein ZapB
MIGDQPHIDQSSLIAGLVETVKMLKSEIDELKKQKDNIKTEF